MLIHLDAAKNAAKRLQRALKSGGAVVLLSSCQKAIATAHGYKDWHHLTATIGTPKAPHADAKANLEAMIRANWPTIAAKAPDIAAAAIGSNPDTTEPADEIDTLRRAWINNAPKLNPEKYENHLRGFAKIDTQKISSLDTHPEITISVETMTNDETRSTKMPIRDLIFNFRRNDIPIGFIHLTIYDRKVKRKLTPTYIADVADMVSDYDLWSVKNILREYSDLFDNAVCLLNSWELAPEERGKGLGVTILATALRHCKVHYRRLQSIAYDPNHIDSKRNPYIGAKKARSQSMQKTASIV